MLPEPYRFIANVGFNDYYYFKLDGFAYGYLAINTMEEVVGIKKRRFRKDKLTNEEIPMSLRLIPLNSLILFLIYQASMLKEYTYEMDVEGNKIPIYGVWDDFDLNDLKKVFKEVIAQAGTSNYEFNPVIHNHVARGFDRDGFMYVATENLNMLNRSYWLIRTTQYGHMHIVEVKETGTEKNSITTDVTEVLLDRSVMTKIAKDLDEGNFDDGKDVDSKEVIEVEDLDGMRLG